MTISTLFPVIPSSSPMTISPLFPVIHSYYLCPFRVYTLFLRLKEIGEKVSRNINSLNHRSHGGSSPPSFISHQGSYRDRTIDIKGRL
jgi:hypothetical protein